MSEREFNRLSPEGDWGSEPEILTTQKALDREEIFSQISEAVEQSKKTGNEYCFQAAISKEGEIVVNRLFKGGKTKIELHKPVLGEEHTHPQGEGYYLPTDYNPYFTFHSHLEATSWPSPQDIDFFFNLSEQNYNMSSGSDPYWINPLHLIADSEGRSILYQFNPEVVAKKSEDRIDQEIGEVSIEIGKRVGIKRYNGMDIEEISPRDILIGKWQGSLVRAFPRFIYKNPELIQEVCQKIGLKFIKIEESSREAILGASRELEIFVPWEE